MGFELVFGACVFATVVRARHRGIPWPDIFSFPSQWFNWTFVGRDFSEPFSAFIGGQVRDQKCPVRLWRALGFTLDILFRVKEKNHCAESLLRLEKYRRDN